MAEREWILLCVLILGIFNFFQDTILLRFCLGVLNPEVIRVVLPEWEFSFPWAEALIHLLFH